MSRGTKIVYVCVLVICILVGMSARYGVCKKGVNPIVGGVKEPMNGQKGGVFICTSAPGVGNSPNVQFCQYILGIGVYVATMKT